jgi:outer membrane lipoprotein-sorting protein
MKKTIVSLLLFVFGIGLIAVSAPAQNVQQVLDKIIDAQGGRAALAAVKDSTFSGTAELIQFGMSGTFTMYQKEPDKMRMDLEMMGMVITQAYDGETAWWINPQTGTDELMNEQQAVDMKRQAVGNAALLDPAKYGISYELKPTEKIEDKDYIVLDQVYKDGFRSTLYIDPQTYLVYKTKAKTTSAAGTELESETFMSNYEKVDSLMVAKSINILQDGMEFMKLQISKVAFNTGLEDDLFKRTSR